MEPLSHEWLRALSARESELIEQCTSPDSADQARRDAAQRLDELRQLIALPETIAMRKRMALQFNGVSDGN